MQTRAKWTILTILALAIISLPFLLNDHWLHIIILTGLESIVAIGFVAQHRVKLLTFCAATFWGIGAYSSAVLSKSLEMDFWACLPLAGMATALVAFFVGLLIVRTGWVTFLMISIVIAEIFVEAIGHINVLGGWDGIIGIPRPHIGAFVLLSKVSYYYLLLIVMSVCIVIFYLLYRSPIGRAWTAIGQSRDLAESIGINMFRYQMAAYVIAAFTAGLSGSLYAHYMNFLVPSTFGIMKSLFISIGAAIGGLHFVISGPIVGSILVKSFPEAFRITDKYEPIFVGAMIMFCALFFRKGILSVMERYINLLLRKVFERER